jgi:hypothetical protein
VSTRLVAVEATAPTATTPDIDATRTLTAADLGTPAVKVPPNA